MKEKNIPLKALHILSKVLGGLLTAVILFLLLCQIFLLVSRAVTGDENTSLFGFKSAVVLTGSMSGTIEAGDLIVTRSSETYVAGDIIMFRTGGSSVTHRITDVTDAGYITKGDANDSPDPDPVPRENVIGRVVLIIPHAGVIIERLNSPLGMLILFVSAFILIILPGALGKRK